jgi:hypothetical protein
MCQQLFDSGYRRVLGVSADPQGYFQGPSGLLIEVIGDELLAYPETYYRQSLRARESKFCTAATDKHPLKNGNGEVIFAATARQSGPRSF